MSSCDCITTTNQLISELNTQLENASPCEATVTISNSTANAIVDLEQNCVVDTNLIQSTSSCVHTVYNFDLPVHAVADALLFGKSMSNAVSSPCATSSQTCCSRSSVWSSIDLTQIDRINSTNGKTSLYNWYAWFSLLSQYISNATELNTYNIQMVQRAFEQINIDKEYQLSQMDTRIETQRREDCLDAAVECPTACQVAANKAYEQQAVDERDGVSSGRFGYNYRNDRKRKRDDTCDDEDSFTSYGRQRRKRARIHIPLNRRRKSDFDHLLDDVSFERDCTRMETNLAEIESRKKGILRAQQLAKNIRDVLQHASGSVAQILALIDSFLNEWRLHECAYQSELDNAGPPLNRRLAFQQQFKTMLLDFRTFMSRQYIDGTVALCENRCSGYGAYYPHFNYVVSDCIQRGTVVNGNQFWTDAQSHIIRHGKFLARKVYQQVCSWTEGAVVSKEHVRNYIHVLERADALMALGDNVQVISGTA